MQALIAFTATLILCSTALSDNVKEEFQERLRQVDASIELLDQCLHILQNGISQCVSTHPDEPTRTVELTTVTQPTEHTTSGTSEHSNTDSPTEGPKIVTEPTEHTSNTADHGDTTNTEMPVETEHPTEIHQEMAEEAERGQLRGGKERIGGRRENEEEAEPPIYVVHIDRSDPSGQVAEVLPYVPRVSSDSSVLMQGGERPTNLLGYPGEEPTPSSHGDPYFVIVDEDGDDGEPSIYIARTVSSGKKHRGSHHGRGPLSGRGPHQKKLGGIDDQLLRLLLLKSKKESNEPQSPISNKWLVWWRNRPTENTSEPLVTEHPEVTEEPSQAAATERPETETTEHPEVTEEPTQPAATEHHKSPPVTAIGTHHPLPSHPTAPTYERPTTPTYERPTYNRYHTSPPTDSTPDTSTPNLNDTNTTSPTIASTTGPTTGSPATIDNTSPTTDTTTSPTTDTTTSPTTGSPATIDNTSPTTSSPTTEITTSPTTETTTSPTTGSPATIDNTNSPTASDRPTTEPPTTEEEHHETDYTDATNSTGTSPTTNAPTRSTDRSTTAPTTDRTQNSSTDASNPTDRPATQVVPTEDDGGSGDDFFANENDTDFATDATKLPSETDSRNDSAIEPRDDLAESYLVVNIDRSTGTEVVSAYMMDDADSQSLQGIGKHKGKKKQKDPLIIDRDKKVTIIVVINEGDPPTSLPSETSEPVDDEKMPLYPDDSELDYGKDDKSDGSKVVPVRVHEVTKTPGDTYGYGKAVDDAINYALQNSKRRKRESSQASHASADVPTEASQPPEHTAQECLKLFSHYFRQYYLRKMGFVHADTEQPTEH